MSNPPRLSFSLAAKSSTKPPPPSGFSFSLKKPGGPSSTSKQPSLSFDDEDDEPTSTGVNTKRLSKETGTNKSLIAKSTGVISRAARKVQEEAVKVDSSVFEYDEVWDGMKAAQKDVERAKEAESLERKVCVFV
jgi:coiled-coil domain-containing protein 55